ncbi:MAG: Cd(II)/Pb(II)-responsive transcriptional regulator [Burkholderiaceae bacterium]|nr:Cd(II)/Pb(II)-responsive transcriptional regulator [Burkholderiaceae bacterium]
MLQIGELAKRAGCKVQTIRFYEGEGLLLEPVRSTGNFRLYDENHLERLLFIRRCRSRDMTLEEIRNLLTFRDQPELNCGEVNELVDAHIVQVRAKIRELKGLEQQLIELRHSCDSVRSAKECGILNGLAQAL